MKAQEALARFKAHMVRHRLSKTTQRTYLAYAERYGKFRPKQKCETPEDKASAFLSTFTTHSVATQKQALNAIAGKNGLYAALGRPLGKLPPWVNAKRPTRVPVWVTRAEAEAILQHLKEPWASIVGMLYGSGLRIKECLSLRWRDIDLERLTVTIRGGKGDKDRVTVLSARMVDPLRLLMRQARALWEEDRARKRPGVEIPDACKRKYPNCGQDWPMFWVFPAAGESKDPTSGIKRRWHIHPMSFCRPIRVAAVRSGITKRVTAHAFRHGFATAYLLAGGNLRELQRLLGHAKLETTEIYLHCLPQNQDRIGSPWDVDARVVPFVPVPQPLRKHA